MAYYNQDAAFGIHVDFTPGQCEPPELAWVRDLDEVHIDLSTKGFVLDPGGAFTVNYTLRFLEAPPQTETTAAASGQD